MLALSYSCLDFPKSSCNVDTGCLINSWDIHKWPSKPGYGAGCAVSLGSAVGAQGGQGSPCTKALILCTFITKQLHVLCCIHHSHMNILPLEWDFSLGLGAGSFPRSSIPAEGTSELLYVAKRSQGSYVEPLQPSCSWCFHKQVFAAPRGDYHDGLLFRQPTWKPSSQRLLFQDRGTSRELAMLTICCRASELSQPLVLEPRQPKSVSGTRTGCFPTTTCCRHALRLHGSQRAAGSWAPLKKKNLAVLLAAECFCTNTGSGYIITLISSRPLAVQIT